MKQLALVLALLPLLALDEQGQVVETRLTPEEFKSRLQATLVMTHESTAEALQTPVAGQPFGLRTVVVGVALGMEAGAGPLKVKAVPRFRLVFGNSSDPALP